MIYKVKQNRVERTYIGGKRLEIFTGEYLKEIDYYPEDWTASVVSAVNSFGQLEGEGITDDGIKIKDLIQNGSLSILVKLLDADERLVIQAHPTKEFAKELLSTDYGKTECWYFLDCGKDACVYLGFKQGITLEKWKEAIQSEDSEKMLSMLNKIPVCKGDFVFVDGGVPHAIGKGCFMIELQEPSDLMVVAEKYTSSGRKIPEIKVDMGLGFEKALNVYRYEGYALDEVKQKYFSHPDPKNNSEVEVLGKGLTDKFSMYILRGNATHHLVRNYAIAVVISGCGKIFNSDIQKEVKEGDRIFICNEDKISTKGNNNFTICVCE